MLIMDSRGNNRILVLDVFENEREERGSVRI